MEIIKCAGYVRVSSKDQIDGESLTTQRKSIADFAALNNYVLTEIYADEGVSGGTTKDRPALLKLLSDGKQGKFSELIIHRLSRFGRNARELLNNCEELKSAGITLHSVSEKIDFASRYGEFMLLMLAGVAQLERDIIREQMLENRIARGRRGLPTGGRVPYGRTYNKDTDTWTLDQSAARKIQQAADDLIAGEKLRDIAKRAGLNYKHLLDILNLKSGDKFTVKFKSEDEPFTYNVPRLLDDETIEKVHQRLKFNRRNNRTDTFGKYLLSGFLRCEKCGCLLSGRTQSEENQYYFHVPDGDYNKCKTFTSVVLKPLEHAVFATIFENFVDAPSFEHAMADSLPNEKMVEDLRLSIKDCEKELNRINKELDKLVDLALTETLSRETIKNKEQDLLTAKMNITDKLKNETIKLNSLPDTKDVMKQANQIRRQLLKKYQSKEHIQNMSFDDKRALLYWLFDGKDEFGKNYGIYIRKTGKGKYSKIDYFFYGKLQGLRTLYRGDINYMGDVDEELKKERDGNIIIQPNTLQH